MTDAAHEEEIRAIRSETEKIRQQIMQLEFQHKKDIVESDRRFDQRMTRLEAAAANSQKRIEFNQKQIDHLIKLVGFTYDELDSIDATLTETGVVLSRPRKRARIQ